MKWPNGALTIARLNCACKRTDWALFADDEFIYSTAISYYQDVFFSPFSIKKLNCVFCRNKV